MRTPVFDATFDPASDATIKREQKTLIWIPAGAGNDRIAIKLYRHRGLVNTIRGYLVKFRTEREHERLHHLAEWQVPCTLPFSWQHGYSRKRGFYEVLATRLLPDAVDLQTWLRDGRTIDLGPLFVAVQRMHESGFRHHALYARNVLVDSGPSKHRLLICDVPRSRVFPTTLVGTRMARLDLADLVATLLRLGVRRDRIPLRQYGMASADEEHFWTFMESFSRKRLYRIARDVESRFKHMAACFVAAVTRQPLIQSR